MEISICTRLIAVTRREASKEASCSSNTQHKMRSVLDMLPDDLLGKILAFASSQFVSSYNIEPELQLQPRHMVGYMLICKRFWASMKAPAFWDETRLVTSTRAFSSCRGSLDST